VFDKNPIYTDSGLFSLVQNTLPWHFRFLLNMVLQCKQQRNQVGHTRKYIIKISDHWQSKLLPSVSPVHQNQFSPSTYSFVALLADFQHIYLKPRYQNQGTYVITFATIISTYKYNNNTQSIFQVDEINF
jgi:hypothetical protein